MNLLTIPEVATRTRLGRSTVYLMVQRGELPVIRFGTAVRIPADALDRWLSDHIDGPSAVGRTTESGGLGLAAER